MSESVFEWVRLQNAELATQLKLSSFNNLISDWLVRYSNMKLHGHSSMKLSNKVPYMEIGGSRNKLEETYGEMYLLSQDIMHNFQLLYYLTTLYCYPI